jgi:hypothetical protein
VSIARRTFAIECSKGLVSSKGRQTMPDGTPPASGGRIVLRSTSGEGPGGRKHGPPGGRERSGRGLSTCLIPVAARAQARLISFRALAELLSGTNAYNVKAGRPITGDFMVDSTKVAPDQVSRRSLLQRIAYVTGAASVLGVTANGAKAQNKVSQRSVAYQNKPKGKERCDNCALFQSPRSCRSVAGDISPSAWCNIYVRR